MAGVRAPGLEVISLRGLHEEIRPYAEYAHRIARYYGFDPRVTSTYRSWGQQSRLRRRYLAGESPFPANRPGDSAHNYGLAWDSVVEPRYQDAWDYIREWVGFEVPGNDRIHAQVPGWRQYVT